MRDNIHYKYVCKDCKERAVGCKKTCQRYLVEQILLQPEKEATEAAKHKEREAYTDRSRRIRSARYMGRRLTAHTPIKCTKR